MHRLPKIVKRAGGTFDIVTSDSPGGMCYIARYKQWYRIVACDVDRPTLIGSCLSEQEAMETRSECTEPPPDAIWDDDCESLSVAVDTERDWIRKMADAEEACPSISAGVRSRNDVEIMLSEMLLKGVGGIDRLDVAERNVLIDVISEFVDTRTDPSSRPRDSGGGGLKEMTMDIDIKTTSSKELSNARTQTITSTVLNGGISDKDAARIRELDTEFATRDAKLAAAEKMEAACVDGPQLTTWELMAWVADRLVNVYGESPNSDFVLSLRRRATDMQEALSAWHKAGGGE